MESTNNNNNQLLFLCEFKELRKELSAMKKRIVQLEESHLKQQERLDSLERENHTLKTQLNINGNKAVGPTLKRNKENNAQEKEIESKQASTSSDKKKTKTKNNNDDGDREAVVIPQYDNGDSFDSLSDDLLHKIVEFDGNCYGKFGLINKRCRNIYDVEEYKLKKQTCVYGYGTLDMMLVHYLQKRKEDELNDVREYIARAVTSYNRFDAIDWIIQLGDSKLLENLCCCATEYRRVNVLTKVFCKCNLTMLDELLGDASCMNYIALLDGQLETLKCLRNHGAKLNKYMFDIARSNGYDEIAQYLRAEGY